MNFKKGSMRINKPKIIQKFWKVFMNQEEAIYEFKKNNK
jgi:hypothetical protein